MNNFLESIPFLTLSCFFEPLDPFVARVLGTIRWTVERGPLDANRPGFSVPQRGGAEPATVTIWSPRSRPDIAVFRAHSEDGWAHLVRKITQKDGPESVSIRSTLPAAPWGLQHVEYHKPGTYWPARIVQYLEEEDGYQFAQEGEPFPFEDNGGIRLESQLKTRTDVLRFMKGLSIDLEDENFWKSDQDAVYLTEVWDDNEHVGE